MKKIIGLIVIFSLFFCMRGIAQKNGESQLSDKTTFKGKRELKKQKRVHRAAKGVTASNAKKARKRNSAGGIPKKEVKKKPRKERKERRKTAPENETIVLENSKN